MSPHVSVMQARKRATKHRAKLQAYTGVNSLGTATKWQTIDDERNSLLKNFQSGSSYQNIPCANPAK